MSVLCECPEILLFPMSFGYRRFADGHVVAEAEPCIITYDFTVLYFTAALFCFLGFGLLATVFVLGMLFYHYIVTRRACAEPSALTLTLVHSPPPSPPVTAWRVYPVIPRITHPLILRITYPATRWTTFSMDSVSRWDFLARLFDKPYRFSLPLFHQKLLQLFLRQRILRSVVPRITFPVVPRITLPVDPVRVIADVWTVRAGPPFQLYTEGEMGQALFPQSWVLFEPCSFGLPTIDMGLQLFPRSESPVLVTCETHCEVVVSRVVTGNGLQTTTRSGKGVACHGDKPSPTADAPTNVPEVNEEQKPVSDVVAMFGGRVRKTRAG